MVQITPIPMTEVLEYLRELYISHNPPHKKRTKN